MLQLPAKSSKARTNISDVAQSSQEIQVSPKRGEHRVNVSKSLHAALKELL